MHTIYSKLLVAAILFFCCKLYAQDSINRSVHLLNYKLQLIETQIKLLEAKQQLSEAHPQQLNAKLQQMDSLLQATKIKPSIKILDTITVKPFKSVFKLYPIRLSEGTFQLSYERALRKNFSIDISAMGTYVSSSGWGSGYLKDQALLAFDEASNSYFEYQGRVITGWGIALQSRNYLLPRIGSDIKAPFGLYAAPQLMYRKTWITGYTTDFVDSVWKENKITQNLDVYSLGVILGGKFTIAKVICVDMYLGGAWRFSKYTNEKNLTRNKGWRNIDYSGVLPTAGITIGILK